MRRLFTARQKAALAAPFAALLLMGGCTGTSTPTVRLAMDGPPLLIAVQSGARAMSGAMDRSCMAGVGDILLYDRHANISCQGYMDRPANDKGRIYADLTCSDGDAVTFVMRNLGPDQGMGIGTFKDKGEQMVMFYHPCEDEAFRRLGQLRADIDAALEKKKKQEEEKNKGNAE